MEMEAGDVVGFAAAGGITLRSYQEAVARAVVESVLAGRGWAFVVMFPRQSGKNELQAQIEAYLLARLAGQDAEMVKVSPTMKPQSVNAMRRLERVLRRHPDTRDAWAKEQGNSYRMGLARITFLSGTPESNIVGATASTLLELDEAQDISIDKYDKEIAPMAASTNATRVFWGTAWTSQTLLARELRTLRQTPEGARRVFVLDADAVAREAPAYGKFVAGQVAALGRNHPMVRTQFYSEEIDAQVGMFPPERLALMQGEHAPQVSPCAGHHYALLVDVGGGLPGCEAAADGAIALTGMQAGRRDATALTIVEVDTSPLADPLVAAPIYRVMARRAWTGADHTGLYAEIRALAQHWRARRVVVDATGVGAGLAAFLARALPGRVIPFIFSSASKSRLGWDFLGIVDRGRWKEADYGPSVRDGTSTDASALQAEFMRQARFCRYTIQPGPGQVLHWGVPDGARDPRDGSLVHDDLLISAALSAVLDGLPWPAPGTAGVHIVRGKDPLEEMTTDF